MGGKRRARPLVLLAAAVLLAACSTDRAAAPVPPGPAGPATARFTANDVNQIEVTVTDRLPARRVELVAPDGSVYPAQSIEAARVTRGVGGGIGQVGPSIGFGLGGAGGSSSGFDLGAGIGIGVPLGQPAQSASGSDIVSHAFIALPDPLQYRLTWPSWHIRVRLGDPPGETRSFELPAPQPPA